MSVSLVAVLCLLLVINTNHVICNENIGNEDATETQNSTATTTVLPAIRRMKGNSNTPLHRDNKLLTLLAARRQSLLKDRWRPNLKSEITTRSSMITTYDCSKSCTSTQTIRVINEWCARNCVPVTPPNGLEDLDTDLSTDGIESKTKNSQIYYTTSESNLISGNQDELLEPEESSHDIYVVSPNHITNLSEAAKDLNYLVDSKNSSNSVETEEVKSFSGMKSSNDIKVKRGDLMKGRQRSTIEMEKSVEESDLVPYLLFGQKIPPSKLQPSRNQIVTPKRLPTYTPPTIYKDSSKLENEDRDLVEISRPAPASTEKSKFWNNRSNAMRNVVNSASVHRRFHSSFSSASSKAESFTASATTVTDSPSTINPVTYKTTLNDVTLPTTEPAVLELSKMKISLEPEQNTTINQTDAMTSLKLSEISEINSMAMMSKPLNKLNESKLMNTRSTEVLDGSKEIDNISEEIKPITSSTTAPITTSFASQITSTTEQIISTVAPRTATVGRSTTTAASITSITVPITSTTREPLRIIVTEVPNEEEITIPIMDINKPQNDENARLDRVIPPIITTPNVPDLSLYSIPTTTTPTPMRETTLSQNEGRRLENIPPIPPFRNRLFEIPDETINRVMFFNITTPAPTTPVPTTRTTVELPKTSTESSIPISTSNSYDFNDRNSEILPDIKQIFKNISLPELETEISSSTSKSITKTTISTSIRSTVVPNPEIHNTQILNVSITNTVAIGNENNTKPLPPVILSTDIPVTISTIIPPISYNTGTPFISNSSSNKTDTDVGNTLETSKNTTNTTLKNETSTQFPFPNFSSLFPKFAGVTTKIPTAVDFASVLTSTNLSTTRRPMTTVFDGVLLRHNSDVTIEMHRMNMATYVLAGLGMFPIVIIVLYVIKSVLFKRGEKNKVSCDLERYLQDGQPISPVVRLEPSDASQTTDESLVPEQREFNRNNLRFKSLLGEGNFGQVWKAEADDLTDHFGTTRIVAVKAERSGNGQGGLKNEAEIMRKLGSHSNVVTLLGACLNQEPHLLIMEFAMRGRLLSLLRTARSAASGMSNPILGIRSTVPPVSPRRLATFALDVARGMEYIAEKNIVHRDLAARNILLDHNGICKICDFGMSIDLDLSKPSQPHTRKTDFIPHNRLFGYDRKPEICRTGCGNDTRTVRPALPIRWMAPEGLQYHIFSHETDVWAFGILMWEILTLGCTPYPTLSGREVVRNIPNGTRPEMPPNCRPEIYDLMTRTWRKDPRQRPTFTETRIDLTRSLRLWEEEDNSSDYLDVSGFSEDLEHGMLYFNRRVSEFECEI